MTHRLLFILTALATIAASGPPDDPRFRRLTVNDGLSQNSAYQIIQDRLGFMWIATQDGLNRYDGYEFQVFKHDPDDANSLSGNSISVVYEDREGILWIGTHKDGLNRLDPLRNTFKHYVPDPDDPASLPHLSVTAISEDGDGNLWIGTPAGLSRLDRASGDFERYVHDAERPGSLGGDIVTTLELDHHGTLWAGTWGGGLSRLDAGSLTFETYGVDPGNPKSLRSNRVTALHEDHDGILWVGTAGGGLSRLDRNTDTFTHFVHDAASDASLSSDEISAIYEDGSNNLWVGTWSGGLNQLGPDRKTLTRYQAQAPGREGLGDNRIHSIVEDRSGVLWIGTGLGGISQLDRHQINFDHLVNDPDDANSLSDNTVWAVHEGANGIVWIGTNVGGLNAYHKASGRFVHYRRDAKDSRSISTNLVRAIELRRNGDLWLGTSGGLDVFRPGVGVVARLHPDVDRRPGVPEIIHALHEDRQGTMWVGASTGLFHYDDVSATFVHTPREAETTNEALLNVLTILESRSGNLWLGSTTGLHFWNRATDDVTSYRNDPSDPQSISEDLVYAVYEDAQGIVWAGTFGGGLNRLDPATGRFRRWTEQNSELPTNTVFGILPDDAGYLWLSTHRGLTRFDPATETFRVFGERRGVQSPEFNSGAAHAGEFTGDLYFGGINGLNIVRPGVLRDNPTAPDVAVTSFKVRTGDGHSDARDKPWADSGEIVLGHNENDFLIDYVGLHYVLPAANRYAYMLENYDDGWRQVGSLREAAYTNLDPGDYVFRVKAASADGVWNEQGASIRIHIRPPWWLTGWAYGAYLMLFIIGIFGVDRLQRRRLIKQERARSQIREAKLRAHTLELENERQTRELEEARELQLSMLPRTLPNHPHVEIDAFMRTATEVGGDYYDFHQRDDGTLTVVVGDATDHGARAGTMVTAVKSLFNVLADEDDLGLFVAKATRAVKRMHFHRLFMAFAVVRIKGRQLRLTGAGMPPALVLRVGTGAVEKVPLKGMPLGSLVDYPYTETPVTLEPGDTVLLMSDGFAERQNQEREFFGYQKAVHAFAATAGMSPREVIQHLVAASDEWAGNTKTTDDITFVVMRAKEEIL